MQKEMHSLVGEWELRFSLRDLFKPSKVHTEDEVRAVFMTNAHMRKKRKELRFDVVHIAIGAPGVGADLCRIRGVSMFDLETTTKILDELSLCIGVCCGQKIVDIFIPSQDTSRGIFRRRYGINRPQNGG